MQERDLKILLKRIILQTTDVDIANTLLIKDRVKNINSKFILEHKLNTLYNKFGTIYGLVNYAFPDMWKPWEIGMVANGFWKCNNEKTEAIRWFVDKIKKDNIINRIEDLPRVCTYKLFADYGLGGLLVHYFNSSPYEAINFYFPNKFVKWEFTLPASYYSKEKNIKEIMEWFVSKLTKDKYISSIDEIPDKVNIDTFRNYNLYSFLINCFRGISYDAFNFLYPGKWHPWEFKSCPTGFWDSEENVKQALEWLIKKLKKDNKIKSVEDIKKLPITKTLEEYKLSTLAKIYAGDYHSLFSLIDENFEVGDFTHRITVNGIKFDSREEYAIHNWLVSNINKNIKYVEKYSEYKFHNKEFDENYVPDWIIDENIIVEYFGWYNENNNLKRYVKYNEKTKRKIKYFSNLQNYSFIAIFPQDLKNNFKGVKNKFKKYNTQSESLTTIRQLSL